MGGKEVGHKPPPYYAFRALPVCSISLRFAALACLQGGLNCKPHGIALNIQAHDVAGGRFSY